MTDHRPLEATPAACRALAKDISMDGNGKA
jgi:hypothetical protein